MHPVRPMRAALLAFALMFVAKPALAESSPVVPDAGCPWVVPSLAETLPANLPAIPFSNGAAFGVSDLALLDATGRALATHLLPEADDALLVLDEALVEGTMYTVRWTDGCADGKTASFTATAAVPMPTKAGVMRISDLEHPAAKCDWGVAHWSVQRPLSFDADPAVRPFLAVSAVEVLLQGEPSRWATQNDWGRVRASSTLVGNLFQDCPTTDTRPRVSLRVRIAGGPTLVTEGEITDLTCGPEPSCPKAPATPGTPATNGAGSSSACSMGTTGDRGLLAPLLACGCLALLNRRRPGSNGWNRGARSERSSARAPASLPPHAVDRELQPRRRA